VCNKNIYIGAYPESESKLGSNLGLLVLKLNNSMGFQIPKSSKSTAAGASPYTGLIEGAYSSAALDP